jgi:PAS domain S-box-containing protein
MDERTAKGNKGKRGIERGTSFARFPLWRILIVLFVAQVLLAVGLVGYISSRNARRAVNEVAHLLRSEVTTRIEERLRSFLAIPHTLNEVNASLIAQGVLDPNDAGALAQHFWQQVQAAPSVSSLYFGNTKGGVADAGREGPQGGLYVIQTDDFAAGTFRKYSVDGEGRPVKELQAVPNFDARTRGWYSGAVSSGGPAWSSIYLLFSGQDMAISASRPVLDTRGGLLGVVAADLFLSQVSDFLRTLKIGTNGQSFIMERSGLLVASSADARPIAVGAGVGTPHRLTAVESSSSMVRAAAATIGKSADQPQSEFTLDGERHFLQVSTIQDGYGIDWLVAVAIPERDFMARVNANERATLVLIVAAAVLAAAFGIVASRWVTNPIRRLGLSAQALARGEWREVTDASRIAEIANLSQSFNSMARQLEQTVSSLQTQISEKARAEERLRASEARYRLLADNSSDVIWTMDLEGRFTYVSPSVEKLRGFTPEEVMREPFSAALTPESLRVVEAPFAELRDRVARGLPPLPVEHLELEQPCKDGTTVWTETVASPLLDEEGRFLAILGVSRNVTARKQAEQARVALEAQLRQSQKLESIGTLASGIAHEINNPLTGIINYAELIERRIDDPQLREFARGIMSEGNRVAEIVRGLLSFARQETTERRSAQMPDVLRTTLALIGSVLRHDQIRVEEDIARGLPVVRCNPQQIQQILINLLTNARDALNRKYPDSHDDKLVLIAMRAVERDGRQWVRTTIEDHGTGVPADLIARIFDPFFTTKPRDMGTGLGLSISYGIAKEHGGSLFGESEEGKYMRFTLDLPAEAEEPDDGGSG